MCFNVRNVVKSRADKEGGKIGLTFYVILTHSLLLIHSTLRNMCVLLAAEIVIYDLQII